MYYAKAMHIKIKLYLILAFILLTSGIVFAAAQLKLDGYIYDEADLLSNDVKASINAFLKDLNRKTSADVVIVTVKSLKGKPVDSFATDMIHTYKLGNAGNSALILIAPNERQASVQVGNKLIEIVTDSHINQIKEHEMIPYFESGDYESGIWRGAYVLSEIIADFYNVEISYPDQCPPQHRDKVSFWLNLFFIIALLFLLKFHIFPFVVPPKVDEHNGFGKETQGGFGGTNNISGRW